jgi:hypothetical protein
MYRSRIVPDTSKKAGLLGINPPMREEIACSCDGCHKPIDPAYPPFQQKIKAFFAGKVVDPTK